MLGNILYFIFTLTGLGFLIFIHELGHYFQAKREGMKVEVFSIGMGKPIFKWTRPDGVLWQVCWIPLGGYVKITGEADEETDDLYAVPDGFYSKSPWARIKVAFMGPLVNIVFAMMIFLLLWSVGGREKSFEEVSSVIGWVDESSDLYKKGIRPGDRIFNYDGHEFKLAKDHFYAAMLGDGEVEIQGERFDSQAKAWVPYSVTVDTYPHPRALDDEILSLGVMGSARQLIYDRGPGGEESPLPEGSPMDGSGLRYGDRLLWMDGEPIYSVQQLGHLLNDNRALLTVKRGEETFLARTTRFPLADVGLSAEYKEEIEDWQFEAGLSGELKELTFIPYNLSWNCIVEEPFAFVDQEDKELAFPSHPFSKREQALMKGDQILAVDGRPVSHSHELLAALQEKQVHIIVERHPERELSQQGLIANEEKAFLDAFHRDELHSLASTIGLGENKEVQEGRFVLLRAIQPLQRKDFPMSAERRERIDQVFEQRKEELASIMDSEKRKEALALLHEQENQWMLGIPLQDKVTLYNPMPHVLFMDVLEDIWRSFSALVSGYLSPKWFAGPIGIVQVMHHGWTLGLREALFWLALISLNLGCVNLLPIPVLDGGNICLSLFEWISGKKLNSQFMERLVIPFVMLIIGFFLFVTYHDVIRLMEQLFRFHL